LVFVTFFLYFSTMFNAPFLFLDLNRFE